MSLSNKKFLINGCGLTYSRQHHKTWVNVLNSVGGVITDISGPAVSNQWIIDRTFVHLLENQNYDHVIVQLTSLGKLDVKVDLTRTMALVETDTLRNFVVDGIWPSSLSQDHVSKQLYYEHLYSPELEVQELFCKTLMFAEWCKTRNIKLLILQGYDIPWTTSQQKYISIINNPNDPLYRQYKQSVHYANHDYTNYNTVPCLGYHVDLAIDVAEIVDNQLITKLQKLKDQLSRNS